MGAAAMQDCGHGYQMGRQIVLTYSEIRIANAFRGVELSSEDTAELERRVISEVKEWKRRKNKIENSGEILDEAQIERGRKSQERHRCKVKARQNPKWGAPIPAGVAIWD